MVLALRRFDHMAVYTARDISGPRPKCSRFWSVLNNLRAARSSCLGTWSLSGDAPMDEAHSRTSRALWMHGPWPSSGPASPPRAKDIMLAVSATKPGSLGVPRSPRAIPKSVIIVLHIQAWQGKSDLRAVHSLVRSCRGIGSIDAG